MFHQMVPLQIKYTIDLTIYKERNYNFILNLYLN